MTSQEVEKVLNRFLEEKESFFQKMGECVGESPSSPKVQKLIKDWKELLDATLYGGNEEFWKGLGRACKEEEAFVRTLEKHGKGTAAFMSEAMEVFCREYPWNQKPPKK